ncbi:methyltransferase domain-containing protein [Streptomyces sp. RKAG290]|uniref:methyltransferase domain-containing protein n=1 Tax=Streptomyces sp. RKAG290 TaxID=2888348 RepID=UPI002034606B|nr:50S ribosomal protein L11 methyltransferase [Streptomyces sp. RKAG290]MCM2413794.1 50S ribosomal protein L11 methyltransferase [Streptomyces sp. RKAG290]
MTQVQSYERSLQRSHASLTRDDRPFVFGMAGREWDLLGEVFAPVYSPSTEASIDFLGLGEDAAKAPRGSFLEIGCGTGVVAVLSALAGSPRVVAADISLPAVRNARMNAERHGVQERLSAVHSDLFSGLGGERFDTVFWSSNYVRAPDTYTYGSIHEAAYVDPGYRTHRRFLTEAPDAVTGNGRVLLHFSDRGDLARLHEIAAECGRTLRTVASEPMVEGEYSSELVEHMLLEVVVTSG